LRKVKRNIDFDFIYNEVKDKCGINGNESVAAPIILKMMLLLIFYDVRSEREPVATIPEQSDWLWIQARTLAKTVASSNSRIPDCCDPKL